MSDIITCPDLFVLQSLYLMSITVIAEADDEVYVDRNLKNSIA